MVKNCSTIAGATRDSVWSSSQEDPLEEEMATQSSILAWKIPWTEEPGELQFLGPPRVRHDCVHTDIKTKPPRLAKFTIFGW